MTYRRIPNRPSLLLIFAFITNFTELEITKIQTDYWLGQMYGGPPNQHFKWAMAHPVFQPGMFPGGN